MGPCYVSIPVDDWDRECEMPALPELTLETVPSATGIERLSAMLDGAGGGRRWCSAAAWPTPAAGTKRSASPRRPAARSGPRPTPRARHFRRTTRQFAGFLPAWRGQLRDLLAPWAIAILVAGAPVFTWHVEGSGPHFPEHAKLMVLSDDPQHLAAPARRAAGCSATSPRGSRCCASGRTSAAYSKGKPRTFADPEPAMTAAYVLKRVAALRPDEAVTVEEAPTTRAGPSDRGHADHPRRRLLHLRQRPSLGYSLPAAVGVAMAQSDKVIAVLGDGATMYTIQGLFAAVAEKANVSFLILSNNAAYAAYRPASRRSSG